MIRAFLLTGITACWLAAASVFAGALEDYVQKPDPSYAWKKLDQKSQDKATVTHVVMTSQTWRDITWTNHMQIVRPAKVRNPDIAFLFITGNGEGKSSLAMLQTLAERAGAVAAVVTRVPNQPLFKNLNEDALIAFTFDRYLKTKDPTWPVLFPMVKSAVRAMDTVAALEKEENGQTITRFVVGGASKRGWTTWLTAATDSRVVGIAPMVIDMLNMSAQVKWAEKVYGRQSEQIRDYTDMGLVGRIDDPEMQRLREWVDPYSYRNRYTMPKLLLLGTNDRYWTVDSLRHYWNDLPGPKLVFQTPNAGHNLDGGREAIPTLAAFFQMIADRQELPKLDWDIALGNPSAKLTLKVTPEAQSAAIWSAESQDRDFRDDKWSSKSAKLEKGTQVEATIPQPDQGYRAFLGEVTLRSSTGHTYKLSTEARVVPDNIK